MSRFCYIKQGYNAAIRPMAILKVNGVDKTLVIKMENKNKIHKVSDINWCCL